MANYFIDRVVQYPGRVVMTPVAGEPNTYDMIRAEGNVTREGTRFNANAFNEIANTVHAYGECTTAGGAAAKVVSCSGFVLRAGATITVKFSIANTSTSACTLNVNGTGAKTIVAPVLAHYASGATTTNISGAWINGQCKTFVYDGTNWILTDPNIIFASELSSLETKLGLR